ncbi:MAG: ATP-dependent helicase [Anaerolineaceae bacterium]|nr:ATP-dependent helicase [Anaerolineaceae bacterium]
MFTPRPKQQKVVSFRKGKMGIAAVPGSGKTQTLSYLAASLIKEDCLKEGQEVLIVTLVRSAVDNFSTRIEGFIKDSGLLPGYGYRVRTLHSLAHEIVRERPDLAGLSEHFQIIDEVEATRIKEGAAMVWMKQHPEFLIDFTSEDIDLNNRKIQTDQWPKNINTIASDFISTAKDLDLSPNQLRDKMEAISIPLPLIQLGFDIYADYQQALRYRSAIDFDDLIRLAMRAIHMDPLFLEQLQFRWPYILEDEAQDSSLLQEKILRSLCGTRNNWVRVGDPNQAIYETFTTANPRYLLDFMKEPDVLGWDLPNSGRSARSIINLANHLIQWTTQHHPVQALRNALSEPYIEPTPRGDPQPNPSNQPDNIILYDKDFNSENELKTITRSLKRWLPENPDKTAAVLVTQNMRGSSIVEQLNVEGIEAVEMLKTSKTTRKTAAVLAAILDFLIEPLNFGKLLECISLLFPYLLDDERIKKNDFIKLIRFYKSIDGFLSADFELLQDKLKTDDEEVKQLLDALLHQLRSLIQRWLQATILPVDQIILTISQEIFHKPADLALSHHFAVFLETLQRNNPDWEMPQFSEELSNIAKSKRKFDGYSDEDTGFDPDDYKGKVIVSTMHKAKGLEWDRVYMVGVNNYDFPSAQPYDKYISEKYFVKDHLNLPVEAVTQLKALAAGNTQDLYLPLGTATEQARIDYSAERLRLLYVGITRAKRELILTWNTGRNGDCQPAFPFVALQEFIREQKNEIIS